MKKAINQIYHAAGIAIIIYGMTMAVRAAGIADLGGSEDEMIRTVMCGMAAMGIGAFVRWWTV